MSNHPTTQLQQPTSTTNTKVMITAIRGSVAALFWSTMLLLLVLTTVSLFLQMLGSVCLSTVVLVVCRVWKWKNQWWLWAIVVVVVVSWLFAILSSVQKDDVSTVPLVSRYVLYFNLKIFFINSTGICKVVCQLCRLSCVLKDAKFCGAGVRGPP